MFRWTEASVSCSNLSAAVTCEHTDSALSLTHLLLMGEGEEPREPDKYSPDIPGPMALKDLGARAVSPGATLLRMPAPTPHTTKSFNKLPALSPSRGSTSATATPVAPCIAPPAPGTSIADTTTGHR
jgi:hypothetical protein